MSAVGLQVSLSNRLTVLIEISDLLGKLGFTSLELKEQPRDKIPWDVTVMPTDRQTS